MKTELLNKKDLELTDLENSQPTHIAKNKKAWPEPCAEEGSTGTNRGLNQLPQQENCPSELKGKETGRNEGRLSDFSEGAGRSILGFKRVLFPKTREQ